MLSMASKVKSGPELKGGLKNSGGLDPDPWIARKVLRVE